VPLENISKGFKDISLSFKRHPVTNDTGYLLNEDAIKRCVINLVRTKIGERFFNSLLGSSIESYLFELANPNIVEPLEAEIKTLLENFEPRIIVRLINVILAPEDNELNVSITYDIVGIPTPRQTINFILQPTRY
jgi:phage baseplate assembly protein W